jgi:hypothetical protein
MLGGVIPSFGKQELLVINDESDIYNRLFIGKSSGLHISFNSFVAFTISGVTWSSDVIPSNLIPVASSSESTARC